jgi:hypothetical protein
VISKPNDKCVEQASISLGIPEKKVYKWGYDRKQVARSLFHVKTEPLPTIIDQDSGNTRKVRDSQDNGLQDPDVVFTSIKLSRKRNYNDLVDEILNIKAQDLNLAKRKYDRKIFKNGTENFRNSDSPIIDCANKTSVFDQPSSFCELEMEDSKDVQFYRSIDIEEQDFSEAQGQEENNHENEFQTKPETPATAINKSACFANLSKYDAMHYNHFDYFEMDLGGFNPDSFKKLNDIENIWATNWTDQELYE